MYDVIVVGAGFAGLRAARDLTAAGLRVLLLEGGDRIGGRAYTRASQLFPSIQVEMGGTYLNRHHHPLLASEADRYGVPTGPAPELTVFRNRLEQAATTGPSRSRLTKPQRPRPACTSCCGTLTVLT